MESHVVEHSSSSCLCVWMGTHTYTHVHLQHMFTHTYTQNNKKYRGSIQRRLWSKMLITQIIVRAGMTSQRGPAVYGLLQSKTSGVSSLRAPSPWQLAGGQHESVGVFFNRSSSLTPLLVRNDSLQPPGLAILTYVGEDLDKQEEGILVCFLVAFFMW